MSFAQITSGPATATGLNTNKQALVFDKQNGIVEAVPDSGTTQALECALVVLQALAALTTITTAQNLISQALNRGVLNKKNRTLRISGIAIFTTVQTSYTVTIVLKLGAVTLATITSPTITNAQTNGQLEFDFVISVATSGAAGTLEVHGGIEVQGGSSVGVAVPRYMDQNVAVSSAVDLTSALTMTVSIASSAAMASAQLRQGLIEIVN